MAFAACVCHCAFVGHFYRRIDATAAARRDHTGAPLCPFCCFNDYSAEWSHGSHSALQVHFQFKSQLVPADNTFPKAIQNLIAVLPVTELSLAFVHGRWVCSQCCCCCMCHSPKQNKAPVLSQFSEKWGTPPAPVASPGATLRARFSTAAGQAEPLRSAWGNLTHTLSGLFCSSLNFMVYLCSHMLYQTSDYEPFTHGSQRLCLLCHSMCSGATHGSRNAMHLCYYIFGSLCFHLMNSCSFVNPGVLHCNGWLALDWLLCRQMPLRWLYLFMPSTLWRQMRAANGSLAACLARQCALRTSPHG